MTSAKLTSETWEEAMSTWSKERMVSLKREFLLISDSSTGFTGST